MARLPLGTCQHAAPRQEAGIFAVLLPEFVHSSLGQLRNAVNVPESIPRDTAKLVLDRNDAFLEPDSRNLISMTVHGSDANWNDRTPFVIGQPFVVERDDNESYTLVR
jgi:hypothetical protein